MSEMMDKSMESPDEDRASLKSNGKSPTNGGMKKLGVMQSLRRSIRRAAEKSPLSPGGKGSKVTPKADAAGSEPGSQPPTSPRLSAVSPAAFVLKNIGNLRQTKVEDVSDVSQQKSTTLTRSNSDPNMSRHGVTKKPLIWFQSLRKKEKPQRQTFTGLFEEHPKEGEEEEEEEEEVPWIPETYTLPEIPSTPMAVMEISKLMGTEGQEALEKAYLQLLSLRQEFQKERDRCGEDSRVELVKKEKDLNLLYQVLRSKVTAIVRDSNSLPSSNRALLVLVAGIIEEEERRAEEPGGLPSSWMEAWREAVGEGVQAKVGGVTLEQKEQSTSWLAVHLDLLGTAIVQDLETVKRELQGSYPPSFNVLSTHLGSYHRVVGQHLKKLEQQVTERKDLYHLLQWTINTYKSEKIMGNPSLQPDINGESTDLQLEENFMEKLMEKYCNELKKEMSSALERIIKLERTDFWIENKPPEKEENFLNSDIHMDIWTMVKSNVTTSGKVDAQLEKKVASLCLKELQSFPHKFQDKFNAHEKPEPVWTEYRITYINCFADLQEHMEEYLHTCPGEVDNFRKEVEKLIDSLMKGLEEKFTDDVGPYLRRMMTRTWLHSDKDFDQLYQRTEQIHEHCELMKPPHAQALASRLHRHVVKEYIGQLMKGNYSCKNRKHEKAAEKIRSQCSDLVDVFRDMKSTEEWLYPVGDDLSNIIGQKNRADILHHLDPLVEHYPDFGKKHLVAVLNFRGLVRGSDHQQILQKFRELKAGSTGGDKSRLLFGDMQVTANANCLPSQPYACLLC